MTAPPFILAWTYSYNTINLISVRENSAVILTQDSEIACKPETFCQAEKQKIEKELLFPQTLCYN
ncbi:hypothetical protein C3V36_11750 [Lachnospiraceae bacterium oral taxon 500]|nr:hypothetical protein C3V36_11750 [Lachnospiraceae bacterium oral taxon 500]